MEEEKRRFTRFILNMNATFYAGNVLYDIDTISNLSIGGCLLSINIDIAPGTPCSLNINLGMGESELSLKIEGKIIRSDHGNIAVKFTTIDPDSLYHLQMLARYNSHDPQKIEEEIKKHPGIV